MKKILYAGLFVWLPTVFDIWHLSTQHTMPFFQQVVTLFCFFCYGTIAWLTDNDY